MVNEMEYKFSCISRRKLYASENYHDNNRTNWYVRKHLTMRICLLMLDAWKFIWAKIEAFYKYDMHSAN